MPNLPNDPQFDDHWRFHGHENYEPIVPPKFVTEDISGVRHKVINFAPNEKHTNFNYALVETTCGKIIALGGVGNKNKIRCPDEH